MMTSSSRARRSILVFSVLVLCLGAATLVMFLLRTPPDPREVPSTIVTSGEQVTTLVERVLHPSAHQDTQSRHEVLPLPGTQLRIRYSAALPVPVLYAVADAALAQGYNDANLLVSVLPPGTNQEAVLSLRALPGWKPRGAGAVLYLFQRGDQPVNLRTIAVEDRGNLADRAWSMLVQLRRSEPWQVSSQSVLRGYVVGGMSLAFILGVGFVAMAVLVAVVDLLMLWKSIREHHSGNSSGQGSRSSLQQWPHPFKAHPWMVRPGSPQAGALRHFLLVTIIFLGLYQLRFLPDAFASSLVQVQRWETEHVYGGTGDVYLAADALRSQATLTPGTVAAVCGRNHGVEAKILRYLLFPADAFPSEQVWRRAAFAIATLHEWQFYRGEFVCDGLHRPGTILQTFPHGGVLVRFSPSR
ncbi:hypothetical protein HY285_04670 [Candidatus Peregrinibacteria bacterium]|nr:hypothetical protein [Candidatus Peregrinibacteria bacterium]MBI3816806.1 hypothetical protein [Candidatus Peregrinibacteria bacterium]